MRARDKIMAGMILSGAGYDNWTTPLVEAREFLANQPDKFKQKYRVDTGPDGAVVLPFLACEPLFETIRDKGIVGLTVQQASELLEAFQKVLPADQQKPPYPDYVYAMKAYVGDFKKSLEVVRDGNAMSYSTDDDAEESLDAPPPRVEIKQNTSFVGRSSSKHSSSLGM